VYTRLYWICTTVCKCKHLRTLSEFFLLLEMACSRPKYVAGGNTIQSNRVGLENSAFVWFIILLFFFFFRFDSKYTVKCNTVRFADLTGEPERSVVILVPVHWKPKSLQELGISGSHIAQLWQLAESR
jgi:hypothetical protein